MTRWVYLFVAWILAPTDQDRLCKMVAKQDGAFGVLVLWKGRKIAHLTPSQARQEALELLDLANLACHPGQCPGEYQ